MEIIGIKENLQRDPPPQAAVPKVADKPEPAKEGEKPAPPPPEIPKVKVQTNEEAARALTENINTFMQSMRYSLQFVVDKQNGQVVIKVLDAEGNLVRRIPPEAMGALSQKIGDSTGMVVNQTLD
jgi:uncharacterized FlaG/YvyC family protein